MFPLRGDGVYILIDEGYLHLSPSNKNKHYSATTIHKKYQSGKKKAGMLVYWYPVLLFYCLNYIQIMRNFA